jgi:DNA-directed RNA polymerase specialized sigma24 family protein
MNCRSIPKQTWEHLRRSLVFYFSRRHCRSDAEDLAQETLLALWNRADYEFEKEEDFPRVCYAFAARILLARRHNAQRHASVELDPSLAGSQDTVAGLKSSEVAVFLEEVQRLGQSQLNCREWQLIHDAMESSPTPEIDRSDPRKAANLRVYLHRARKKLALLSGWRKGRM